MMRFDDYARDASKALLESGRSVALPSVHEMWARRRRRVLVLGSTGVVFLVAAVVAIAAALGNLAGDGEVANGSQESIPAATVPIEGGGVLFGPPRIEAGDSVEFPITLLDGTGLTLTLPRSLANEVRGLVPSGAASWMLDPCCARSLDVVYGSVDDLYGDRLPDVEYEDAEGNLVDFYTDEEDLDYLVFQYGSWVVRVWDGDAAGQRFTEENRARFASLMRGRETSEGFLVLDPVEPMTIGPTDSPDATLTTGTGEGLVGVFKWRDCAAEGPSADPDLVTSAGHRVSFAERSGMTSICFPESSLFLWVSRLDLSEAELEDIDLILTNDQPDVEPVPTTSIPVPTPTSSSTTEVDRPDPLVSPLPTNPEVPLKIVAIRPNNPSIAVVDLEAGELIEYPPGFHALPTDATDGAVITPNRDLIIWTNGVARLFTGGLGSVTRTLGPTPPRGLSGIAPALRVVPLPDGRRAWLVQPGITSESDTAATLVELIDLSSGEQLLKEELDENAFPIASTSNGLILNTEDLLGTDEGFVSAPGSQRVMRLDVDGTVEDIGEGRAIAASDRGVAVLMCPPGVEDCEPFEANQLSVVDTETGDRVLVPKPGGEGVWLRVGGPSIPSDAMPLQTVSPDGSTLLVSLGLSLDVNGTPAGSSLIAVDLTDGTTRIIADFGGPTPLATWSADGEWVALIDRVSADKVDIQLVNFADPNRSIRIEDAIPAGHFPLAAG